MISFLSNRFLMAAGCFFVSRFGFVFGGTVACGSSGIIPTGLAAIGVPCATASNATREKLSVLLGMSTTVAPPMYASV